MNNKFTKTVIHEYNKYQYNNINLLFMTFTINFRVKYVFSP